MFQYKGTRNYLHGTDFYRHTMELLQTQPAGISYISNMTFRHFARHQCTLTMNTPISAASVPCQGEAIQLDGTPIKFYWEETTIPVSSSYPYDEDALVAHATVNDDQSAISLPKPTAGYSCIEVIVALTKKLHYIKSANINGKWVFGQLNLLCRLPIQYKTAEVRLKTFDPGRFSVSAIILDGELYGSIRFIVGQP